MERIILGVDPGTLILGYSVLKVDGAKVEILDMDVLYMKKIPDYNLRIRHIFDSMVEIIDKYHPDHLAIEAPFFGKNVQSMLKLGRAQGVTIAAAMSRDMPFSEYEPTVIKQSITGNGNASKLHVANVLQAIFGFDEKPQYMDATDALAAAYCHYMHSQGPQIEIPKVKKSRSKKQSWSDYIAENPEMVSDNKR